MANNLPTEKKTLAVSMLAEGNSIRSIERMTGAHRDTIMRLGVRVGEGCAKIQNDRLRNLGCKNVEVDEIWGFVGAKRKNADRIGAYMNEAEDFIRENLQSLLSHGLVKSKTEQIPGKWEMLDNEIQSIHATPKNIEFGIALVNGTNCLQILAKINRASAKLSKISVRES